MTYQLIQISFFPVVLCVLFASYIVIDRCFSTKIRLLFFMSVCTILALIIVDDIEFVELQKNYVTNLRYLETTLGYIIRPLIAISVVAIFEESTNQKSKLSTKILFILPYIANVIAVAVSPWNGIVYSFTPDNQFVRGSLGYITFVVGFLYMGLMLLVSVKSVKIKRRGEVMVIFIMFVLCITGTMLESLYLFVGFLSSASIIGVVLYYLFLHVSVYSLDGLTGAYNRRIFYLDLKKITEPTILISMDLNNLKEINDKGGHQKGDEFIISFAQEIVKLKSSETQFYRTGGDEFMLLCKNCNMNHVVRKIEALQQAMNQKNYSFAYGITFLSQRDDIVECIEYVDQLMYQKKQEMKRQKYQCDY